MIKNWIIKNIKTAIVEKVYETMEGNLIFIIEDERNTDDYKYAYVRLYQFPLGQEFGWISMEEYRAIYGKFKMWEVKRKNWSNINSYQDDLLNKVEE